ncbi:hypothetical protein BSK50_21305 [Paenibacillus odorifer]|nr:hypothetical protein BSK50_21305 [Paenibacillus odorifer]
MQSDDVEEIRRQWKEKNGDKPCNHPNLLKEYYLGSSTGDYVCDQCGMTDSKSSWNKRNKL